MFQAPEKGELQEREEEAFRKYVESGGKDAKAENALFSLLTQHALKVCRRLLDRDREDAAQEIVLKAFLNLPNFKEESKFTTWFHRIALNHATNTLRNQKGRDEQQLGWAWEGDARAAGSSSVEGEILVEEVLGKLSEEERKLLEMRLEGSTFQEMGEATEERPNTSQKKFYKVAEKVRRRL